MNRKSVIFGLVGITVILLIVYFTRMNPSIVSPYLEGMTGTTYPIASKTLNDYKYVGCWKDNDTTRALNTKIGDGYTMSSCIDAAKSKGFDTAALQDSTRTCWGGNQGVNGNDYKMYEQKQDSDPTCNESSPGSLTNVTYSIYTEPTPAPTPAPTPEQSTTPTPTPTPTPSLFSPRSYIQSYMDSSNIPVITIPTTYTRNLDSTQQPQKNTTTISFEPNSSTTTTITFAQIPTESTNKEEDSEKFISDSSTYYPYKSVYTTQPTAQQLLPYLTNNSQGENKIPITARSQGSPLISNGGTYYFSSTPQEVPTTSQ